jgi:hypothetical protein
MTTDTTETITTDTPDMEMKTENSASLQQTLPCDAGDIGPISNTVQVASLMQNPQGASHAEDKKANRKGRTGNEEDLRLPASQKKVIYHFSSFTTFLGTSMLSSISKL